MNDPDGAGCSQIEPSVELSIESSSCHRYTGGCPVFLFSVHCLLAPPNSFGVLSRTRAPLGSTQAF